MVCQFIPASLSYFSEPVLVWSRVLSRELSLRQSDWLVSEYPQTPFLFQGLAAELGVVAAVNPSLHADVNGTDNISPSAKSVTGNMYSDQGTAVIQYLRRHAASPLDRSNDFLYRVFSADNRVEKMSIDAFLSRSLDAKLDSTSGSPFVYMETSSWDPHTSITDTSNDAISCADNFACRGDHLIDRFPISDLNPRPLAQACNEDRFMKTRCYLKLDQRVAENGSSGIDVPMVVDWHTDGFDQIIVNALGSDQKLFELWPPVSPEFLSGWLPAHQKPSITDTVDQIWLRPGDVLYLPARWCHRVVTHAPSFTINWGFYSLDHPEMLAKK